ncbi:dolichol-phosphate mannosyltransferase [Filimonas zeae]|uniref:Glycosyl transferase family 2 n=1 Tax=Filimonas zeae TaxID=1737353 RepID=A0A917J5H5_9BACT|nr:glycosyltransferase family 2 protein [Filimonas zeae]MDR6342488.1 dolichol-phosphate mannosyltransferase [Filimonas zeae]GGH81522.1 glycosyl transferase family 2 [Filimonas zeae]
MTKLVSVVVPVYNEKDNVVLLSQTLRDTFAVLPYRYNTIFVDDGSTDGTADVIRRLAAENKHVRYISFSRNFGHQAALKAGLDMADGDCVISMDGDMQHPPELIPVMLQKWEEGYDVVYTLRREDENLSYFKRTTSNAFYSMLNRLSDITIEKGAADFRLLNRNVVEVVRNFQESDLFFRGLVKWSGFKQLGIEYDPAKRNSGVSKYTFKKMMRFALQGITSFSTKPLYAAIYLGFVFSLLALLYIPYVLYSYWMGHVISGWASIIVTIAFFGGMQLMILGIIGLYLGKLFMQSKKRPIYIVKESNIS